MASNGNEWKRRAKIRPVKFTRSIKKKINAAVILDTLARRRSSSRFKTLSRIPGNGKITYLRGSGNAQQLRGDGRRRQPYVAFDVTSNWLVKKQTRWWIRFPRRKVIYEPHESRHRSVPGTTWGFEDSSATETNYDARYTHICPIDKLDDH